MLPKRSSTEFLPRFQSFELPAFIPQWRCKFQDLSLFRSLFSNVVHPVLCMDSLQLVSLSLSLSPPLLSRTEPVHAATFVCVLHSFHVGSVSASLVLRRGGYLGAAGTEDMPSVQMLPGSLAGAGASSSRCSGGRKRACHGAIASCFGSSARMPTPEGMPERRMNEMNLSGSFWQLGAAHDHPH